jgi:hypothetical protein
MSEFDRIALEYINSVDSIDIDYSEPITNIVITIGQNVQTVYSVNSLYGDINLTASAALTLTSSSAGYYNHRFTHNLNYQNVIVSVFNPSNQVVMADILNEDPNYVNIRAVVNLTGYKAVAQR